MLSNIEQYRETVEREGEAQNTTLHDKFSKFMFNDEIEMHITNTSGNQPSLSILPI